MSSKQEYSRRHKKQKIGKVDKQKVFFDWMWLVDYLFIPALIFWFAFEPNFMHGFIDYLEDGVYLSAINEVFYGKVPLKDIFSIFGPLHIYLPAFVMLLFGKSLAVLRSYFHFGGIISLIVAYILGRNILRTRFFSYLFAFLLVLENTHPFWSARWGGIRMGLGLLALLSLVKFVKVKKNLWIFFAGLFSAISLLYTLDIGVSSFAATLVIISIFFFNKNNGRSLFSIKMPVFYCMGAVVIMAPFLVFFLIKGALPSYVVACFGLVKYHMKVWGQRLPPFLPLDLNIFNFFSWIFSAYFKMYLPIFIYSATALYVVFKLFKKQITRELIIIAGIAIYGILLYASAFRGLLGAQFQAALPVVLILACLFLEKCFFYSKEVFLRQELKSDKAKLAVALFSIGTLLFSFAYFLFSEKRYYVSLSGWIQYQANKLDFTPMYSMPVHISQMPLFPLDIERAKGIKVPGFEKDEIENVVGFILKNTEPSDSLFTFPEHGIFNFFADRRVVSRFPIAGFAHTTSEYSSELLLSLEKAKPKYIIFGINLSNLAKSILKKEELLPEVSNYVKTHYNFVKRFGTIDIYRLKND